MCGVGTVGWLRGLRAAGELRCHGVTGLGAAALGRGLNFGLVLGCGALTARYCLQAALSAAEAVVLFGFASTAAPYACDRWGGGGNWQWGGAKCQLLIAVHRVLAVDCGQLVQHSASDDRSIELVSIDKQGKPRHGIQGLG